MSASSSIGSIPDSVNNRWKHVAVAHNGRIIVWGGAPINEYDTYYPPDQVLVHKDHRWRVQPTTGESPFPELPGFSSCRGQVLDRKLFVSCAKQDEKGAVHSLDLATWTWQKLEPGGRKPTLYLSASTWVYDKSIYFFGGFNASFERSNRLVALNTRSNKWWWPECSGQITSLAGHVSVISGCRAFVCGGTTSDVYNSDLYCLDMTSLVWEKFAQPWPPPIVNDWPRGRDRHSLTMISDGRMLLYGGISNYSSFCDCWIMDLYDMNWNRCEHLEAGSRYSHQAVLEEQSGQLWIIEGQDEKNNPGKILKLAVNAPLSLLLLAAGAVEKEIKRLDFQLEEGVDSFEYFLEDAMKEKELFESRLQELPCELKEMFMCSAKNNEDFD